MQFWARALVCGLPVASVLLSADWPTPRAQAANEPAVQDQLSAPERDNIARLVRDLGSSSFAARQRATRELTERGIVARAALEQASSDPDAEVRVRAREILAAVREADFRDRLEAFSADQDGSRKVSLPGWEQFSAIVGANPQARQLFVEMQHAEPELLEAFANGGKAVNEVLLARCRAIIQQVTQSPRGGSVSLGTVATMLFVGSAGEVTVNEQTGSNLFVWLIYQPVFRKQALAGVSSPMLKKLIGLWILKDPNRDSAVRNLESAAVYDLKAEALSLATRVLSDNTHATAARQSAILLVGRYGGKEQLTMIEKLLTDTTSCGTVQVTNPPRQVELQIRDVALAVALHLTGQNLKEYGYPNVQPHPASLFQVGSLVFPEPAQRDLALKKWEQWRAEHPLR